MSASRARLVRFTLTYLVFALWSFVIFFPLYWVAITAFKYPIAVNAKTTYLPWIDFEPTLDAWRYLLVDIRSQVVKPFLNSIVVANASAALALFIGGAAAYGLTRFQYRFLIWRNDQIALWFLSQRVVPPVVVLVPFLVMYRFLDLIDTHVGLIAAYTVFNLPLTVWITRDFFAAIPRELEESAMIDGCSQFGAFWRIAVPLVANGLVAAYLVSLIFTWNEYLFALILTGNEAMTMPILIAGQNTSRGIEWWTLSALVLIEMVPVICGTVLLQRFISRGLIAGALKG
ncbi:MAG TPA: carbohydrate ABC transporter permease [Chloroflexota bacterium]|nr:carbohydrate ABC transporter permease [Chloroflexota bacterium]